MSDVNANIGINFDTQQALASLRQLQAGLSRFNQSLTQGNVAAENAQKGLNAQLMQSINATGKFVASQRVVADSTTAFTTALEKNQLSMGQYFKFTAAAATANTKVFSRMFSEERDIFNRARKDRVKALQTQYIQLTGANGDLVKVLQVVPKHLKMVNGQYADYATRTQMAAQRQQMMNQLLKQGSTQLLNFGKNTQWAGRQLMVGLTVPLTMLGSAASKVFMEMEKAVIAFTRVYGDMTTSGDATNKAVADIQRLAKEFTKYGIAATETVEMAAKAAAMGLTGNDLNSQVIAATRLAVLGQVEQQQALETTISLQNAFGISAEELAKKINYLNAVENQTVLSIEDLTIAIPKAGPVIQQLGGSVEDLAFFMTAMKEGGINASEGANALKSGLASMINPSKKASEFLAGLGVNIKGIVEANSGNLKGTIVGFARALDTLDPLNRARAIEQMFGKFQFARLSTLFKNVTSDTSQAARALGLAGASVEELAILSERELGKVEDAVGVKFQKTIEQLKLELIPIGKTFLQALTPVVEFLGKILSKFNNFSDGTKKAIAIVVGVVGGLAPVALMTFGLLANGLANIIKFFAMLRSGMAKLNGQNQVLGGGFDYLTQQEIENLAQSNALHTSHQNLISTFNVEAGSVNALAAAYANAASQARTLASSSPGLFNTSPGPAGAVAGLPPKKFATGGVVPGTGNKDTVPALLTPGEVVITKDTAKANPELVAALQNNSVMKYSKGTGKTGKQSAPGRTGFNIGGESYGLAISPKSDKVVAQVEKLATAMQDGSLGIENGADVLKEVFARLADDSRVTLTEFVQELRIATKSMSGTELTPAQINAAAGSTGPNDKVVGHSATEAGVSKNVRDQMYAAGRGEEYERLQKIANATGDRLQEERPDLPRLQRPDKKNVQLDRGHIGAIGATEKGVQEGWDPDLWDLSTHAENEMAQTLSSNNDARRVYLEKLHQSSATEEEILAIAEKVTTNGALNERELQIQSEVLQDMLLDKEFMAAEQKKAGKGKPMSIEKTMLATVYDAEGRASIPLPETADPRSVAERRASGDAKVKSRFGKNNAPGVSSEEGFVPLSESERQARLESLKIAEGVDSDLTDAEKKAETASPSKRTKRLGKDIADGLALGLEEGKTGVKTKSSELSDAAIPTAADTQSRVDKMDLTNKAFYDDLDTPELRDERQILKSQDRNRRKRGASATVDSMSGTPVASQTASLTIASSKRTADASEQLAIKTEEAVQAEAQVVQQIRDESKNRTTIKGNTINIGKAREDADKADNEAAILRSRAAAIEKEQAIQRAKNSPTTITDAQVKEAREKANAAELEAAKTRQTLAMAEADGKNITITEDDVKTPGKVKKIQDKNEELISNGTQEQGDLLRRTVAGSEDVADSTVLVADQTSDLADATQEAVITQTGNNQNLLTAAQLANATAGNLGDVANATDQTGTAQQSVLESTQNIAQTNEQIEEQKRIELQRLKDENARRAALANAPIVPPGTQSGNPKNDPSKLMGSVEAYDYAMGRDPGTNGPDDLGEQGFTRDKKGHIVMDPEKDANGKYNPTKMSLKQVAQKKRGMRREAVGRVSGKASGVLGAATMAAGMAGAPPQVTAALGAASTVSQFAPMLAGLTGPQGIVVALGAVAAGAYLFNKHLNAMAGKAAQFAKDLSATRDGLKAIGEMSGKVGASQIMDKRREKSIYGKYDEAVKINTTFGNNFLGSEPGKKEKKLFQQNVKEFGKDKAVEDLALKLSTAVADGVLDSNAANSIAAAMAIELKDSKLEMQVIGQISSLIGPDGKNLKDNPMETRIGIMAKAGGRTAKLEDEIAGKTGFGESSRKEVAALAALNMNNLELATMMADQVQVEYEAQKKKLEAELASTSNAAEKLRLSEEIAKLDAQNLKDTQFMNDQILSQINRNAASFAKVYSNSVWGKQAMREDAYLDASKAQVESTYKGTDQEEAAKSFLNKTKALKTDTVSGRYNSSTGQYVKTGLGTAEAAQKFQAKMEMLVGSKVLSPGEATSYMDLFRGKLNEMDFLLNMGIKTKGIVKTKELFSMFSGFSAGGRKKATSIISEMIMKKKDPAEFDSIMESLKSIQALDGNTIDFEVMVKTVGLVGIEQIKKEQEAIEKLKEEAEKSGGKMDLDKAAAVDGNMAAAVAALKGDEERLAEFNAATREQQAEYLQKLAAQFMYESTVNDKQRQADIQMLAQEQALMEAYDKGIATDSAQFTKILNEKIAALKLLSDGKFAVEKLQMPGAGGVTSLDPGPTKTPTDKGAGSNPLDFLDSLAMRIKNVRDGAFDATKPLKSMMAAFNSKKAKKDISTMFDVFDGLQQRMLNLKVPKEMRDMIAGMSSEDFTKFAKLPKGKNMFTYDKYTSGKNKGKEKPRTQANIKGLTTEGKAVFQTMREADLGDAQYLNKENVTNVNEQRKAMNMLMSSGMSAADALATVENQAVASAIANKALGKAGSKEMKAFAESIALSNDALERQAVLQNLTQKNADFKFAVQAQEFATAFANAGLSVDQINEVLQDPGLTRQLITDLKDGKIDSAEIAEYLNSIPQRLQVEITTAMNKKDFAEAAKPGLEFVDQMFAIEEALIRAGAKDEMSAVNAKKIKDNEALIEAAEKELRLLQDTKVLRESLTKVIGADGKALSQAMNYQDLQDAAKAMQDQIEKVQRDLEVNTEYGSRVIDGLNEKIEGLNRTMEMNPDWGSRAIQKLQDESSVLSHDLDLINKAAEGINEKYDKQAEALQKVQQINQNILALQQDQLDLAGSLTSGDISSAAKAAQKMRATAAGQFASGQTEALEQARKNSIDSLKSGSGMTSKQIQDRQYEISEKIYAMETNPAKLKMQKDIQTIQDSIYAIEEKRKIKMDEIQKVEDAIYAVNQELAKDDGAIDKINRKLDGYNTALGDAQKAIDDQVKKIKVLGTDKEGWDLVKTKFDAYTLALKSKDVKDALKGLTDASGAVEKDWDSINGWLDQFMAAESSKDVNLNVITTYSYVGTPPAGYQTPDAGCPEGFTMGADGKCTNNSSSNNGSSADSAAALRKLTSGQTLTDAERALLGMSVNDTSDYVPANPGNNSSNSKSGNGSNNNSADSAVVAALKAITTPVKNATADAAKAAAEAAAKAAAEKAKITYSSADAAKSAADKKQADLVGTKNNSGVAAQAAAVAAAADKAAKAAAAQRAEALAKEKAANAKTYASISAQEAAKNASLAKASAAAAQAKAAADAKAKAEKERQQALLQAVVSYGGNSGRASAGYALTLSSGGIVPKYFASGGFARGTDIVPAMLTPGEFVMSKYAVDSYGTDKMKAINSGASVGDSVYNYSLTVNTKSDASPDDIARTVMAQIKQIDSQRIRGVRI